MAIDAQSLFMESPTLCPTLAVALELFSSKKANSRSIEELENRIKQVWENVAVPAQQTLDAAMKKRQEMVESLKDRAEEKLQAILEFHEIKQNFCSVLAHEIHMDPQNVETDPWKNFHIALQIHRSQAWLFCVQGTELLKATKKLLDLGYDVSSMPKDFSAKYAATVQHERQAHEQLKTIFQRIKMLANICNALSHSTRLSQAFTNPQMEVPALPSFEENHTTYPVSTSMNPEERIKNTCQAVYSLAQGNAILVQNETSHTLVLKVFPDRYIKLRNVVIMKTIPSNWQNSWVTIGTPAALYIYKHDLEEKIHEHNDSKYGPYADIEKAYEHFLKEASSPIEERASMQPSLGKLAVEMDDQDAFRIVKRKEFGHGTCKKVFEETVFPEGLTPQKIARAHLKNKELSENEEIQKKFKAEIEISMFLHSKGVPNIVVMKMGKSQNLKKVRAEMPFLSGGNLEAMVTHNVITPDVRKKHLKYMLQIAQAVLGMHNLQIAHCDLKLTNFLFDKEKDTAFLSDFGLASQFKSKAFAGTFPAPECAPIQPKLTHSIPIQATPENDCWAFGLALFSMLRGKNKMIYTFRAAYDRGQKTIQETGKAICTFLEKSNDPADKLIQQLLSQDPQHRPPMQKIVTQLEALI